MQVLLQNSPLRRGDKGESSQNEKSWKQLYSSSSALQENIQISQQKLKMPTLQKGQSNSPENSQGKRQDIMQT